MVYIPTKRLVIANADDWEREALSFAEEVAEAEGTRQPCFEVWWPAPQHLSDEEASAWLAAQGETFDAVCVDLDAPPEEAITTLPPYSELAS